MLICTLDGAPVEPSGLCEDQAVILGVESRKERQEAITLETPGNGNCRNSGMQGAKLSRGVNGTPRNAHQPKHEQDPTFLESSRHWRRFASHSARRPARKRKKTDDGTSEQSSPVRLQGLV